MKRFIKTGKLTIQPFCLIFAFFIFKFMVNYFDNIGIVQKTDLKFVIIFISLIQIVIVLWMFLLIYINKRKEDSLNNINIYMLLVSVLMTVLFS